MKVIGLYNKQDSGKTNTLNLVIKKLLQLDFELLEPNKTSYHKYINKRVLLESKKLNIRIAISTFGDSKDDLDRNIKFFETHQPDIAISAARTKCSTKEILDNYAKSKNTKTIWLEQPRTEDKEVHGELNKIGAYLVLKNILANIDGAKITISQSFQFEIS